MEIIIKEGLQNLIWDSMFYCVHSIGSGFFRKECNPNKGCAGGKNMMLLGKGFEGICIGRVRTHILNPDKAAVDGIKRLLDLEKKARDEAVK